ncbi:C2 domain [Plasmopara halstedii]|uniref:C2 domain n=1 Tax=Plasmopara halstedii TaxID=4781 RepID=A0A0P1ABX1_PLAHL|nr:C2 domain [Plasmopara halstedii]CEG37800.1 C2 domain [Plasmopara halstedii]|eukprot:XP_024574169.1 C2 domain [Plasmopara halstedii]
MSAVDDVAARIRRLDEMRSLKTAQLRQLQHELCYNSLAGVDERLENGRSVARLDVKVEAGRNLVFKAGFLSGQRTYVRVTVEVVINSQKGKQMHGSTIMEQKFTTKRPVGSTPRWNETLSFEGLPAAVGTVKIEIMQEEKIGSDEVVGSIVMPLARLQDQRLMERWHVLDKTTASELLLGCKFSRSPISALQLELELLQNQSNELHLFVGRHQNLVEVPKSSITLQSKPLQGKEVVPEETPEQAASTRFSAVASFPPVMRKREFVENVSMNIEMHEAPRVKRQRYAENTEKQVSSLSDRIANWLLPTTPSSTSTFAAKTDNSMPSPNQFFPFKQRQATPAPRRSRRTGRVFSATSPKTPSALQAIEKWLFTDKDGNPRDLPFGRQTSPY